ncbi:EF-P lysine aminoacylase GenX [Bdellovibrio bacteriovorus]|uniref:EF-P lysine aminoacylase GenX n=2 Tax=Bdellovibrio bacteriovorus TaxID=959 RepID=A0A150WIV1_BDEBC|nr:EF-P lysine aminoacylase GenX [Bdellovibrio bacteriovorus]
MPSGAQAAGRIYKIEKDGESLKLTLSRDNKIHKIEFAKAPEHSEFLLEGDLVAVVSATQIVLLAPQKAPLPKRIFNKDLLASWSEYLQGIKDFFTQEEFLELKTPSLVACPGTEPSLDVFSTVLQVGSRKEKLYLPTSPELHLKKALALGAEKIFEIAPCFRNGEITERHQPEFLMLEWYRAYDNLSTIKIDVEKLVVFLAKKLKVEAPKKVRSVSIAELFKHYCDFDLQPDTTKGALKSLATKLGVDVRSAESIDDYFFLIFMEKIESVLPANELIFVEKYPPYQAALARLTEDGWGDRFEVYWKGLELANAFHELNDPGIQRLRSNEDLEKKKDMGKEVVTLDEEFFQCLEAGMPPSGGIALGLERLFMALIGLSDITNVRVFSKS